MYVSIIANVIGNAVGPILFFGAIAAIVFAGIWIGFCRSQREDFVRANSAKWRAVESLYAEYQKSEFAQSGKGMNSWVSTHSLVVHLNSLAKFTYFDPQKYVVNDIRSNMEFYKKSIEYSEFISKRQSGYEAQYAAIMTTPTAQAINLPSWMTWQQFLEIEARICNYKPVFPVFGVRIFWEYTSPGKRNHQEACQTYTLDQVKELVKEAQKPVEKPARSWGYREEHTVNFVPVKCPGCGSPIKVDTMTQTAACSQGTPNRT